ncbi:unnamed protein product, partial [Closterium sp. NIES-54]
EAVEEGVQKFFDLLTRLEGADLNYSELQKKTNVLALLPESCSLLIINLNRDLPRLSLEDMKRAILQEDFRRHELASADGAGAARIGRGYGRGRGRGRGGGRFGRNNFNGGRGSGGYGSDNKSYERGRGRFTRGDIFGAIASSPLMDGPLLKAKRVEEQEEGEEEAVEAVAVAEDPATVGKLTLHSLDYWVIDSGATYSMTPRADLLTELEPSTVKHVTPALGQRAEVKGMGKAMFKGADGKMVGLKNNEMVAGIRVKGEPNEVLGWPTCMQAKFTRYLFSSSEAMAKAPLDEVVMDVVGPLKLGAAGAEYFLTIVDVYTCMTWVYVLSKNSDVAEMVKTN